MELVAPAWEGRSALWHAAADGDMEQVAHLITRKAIVSQPDIHGCTPLFAAVCNGHVAVMRFLVKHGASASEACGNEWMPLHAAAEEGNMAMAIALVEAGANISATADGDTALTVAACNGHVRVVAWLASLGGDFHVVLEKGITLLWCAANHGHVDLLAWFIDQGLSVHTPSTCGQTPLFAAAGRGHLNAVKLLAAHGANCVTRTDRLATPVYFAVQQGRFRVVQWLLGGGAMAEWDVMVHLAKEFGQAHMVAYLNTIRGLTPFQILLHSGATDDALRLLTEGVDPTFGDKIMGVAVHGRRVAIDVDTTDTPATLIAEIGHRCEEPPNVIHLPRVFYASTLRYIVNVAGWHLASITPRYALFQPRSDEFSGPAADLVRDLRAHQRGCTKYHLFGPYVRRVGLTIFYVEHKHRMLPEVWKHIWSFIRWPRHSPINM